MEDSREEFHAKGGPALLVTVVPHLDVRCRFARCHLPVICESVLCRFHRTLIAFPRSQTSLGGFHYGSRHHCVDHYWSYRGLDHRKADEGRWLRCADGYHRRHCRRTHWWIYRRTSWFWR